MTAPVAPRVVVSPLEPLCGSGSEGSEGSKGSEGCGIALTGDEYIVSATGFTFVSPVLHDGILKPPSFVRM